MDRPKDQKPAVLTPEGHEQSLSKSKGKQRNDGDYLYQDGLQHH